MHTIVLLTGSLLVAVPAPPAAPTNAPVPAVAAPVPPAAAAPEEPEVWYGRSAAIADGVALSLLVGGLGVAGTKANSLGGPAFLVGIIGYEFIGPIDHLSYHHGGMAAASLGLRLVATMVGGYFLIKASFDRCNSDNGTDTPGCNQSSLGDVASITVPFIAAAVLDDFVLANGTVAPPPSTHASPTIAPGVGPGWAMLSCQRPVLDYDHRSGSRSSKSPSSSRHVSVSPRGRTREPSRV